MIDARTIVCCLLGNPVAHSFSPLVHNRAFQACGLNFVYTAFRVEDLAGAIRGIRALGVRGASVTIPFKIEAIRFLDRLEEEAQAIGAVNTIVNEVGELIGYNSDGRGAVRAFEAYHCPLDGKDVILIGSGGAARAVGFALVRRYTLRSLSILGIIEEQVCQLRSELQKISSCPVKGELRSPEKEKMFFERVDVIINCSPIGMLPDYSITPIPESFMKQGMVVFDAVYNPLKTTLLKEAERKGCRVIPGVEMFLHQAAEQFELWTGVKAPLDVMRAAVVESIGGGKGT